MENIKEGLKAFLEENFLIDFDKVTEDANLFKLGYIDSFGIVELVSFIENEFKIQITNEELIDDSISSLEKMVSTVESKTR